MKFISILLLSFFAFLQIIKVILRLFFKYFLFFRKEKKHLVEDYSATAALVSSCIGCGVCFNISKTMVFDIVYLRGTYPGRYIDKPLGCPYKF